MYISKPQRWFYFFHLLEKKGLQLETLTRIMYSGDKVHAVVRVVHAFHLDFIRSLWTGLPVISFWDLFSVPKVFVYFTTYLIKIQHITARIGEKDERYTNRASGHFQYFHWISFALLDNFRVLYFLYFIWLNWNSFNCLAEWLPLFRPWFSMHFCTG